MRRALAAASSPIRKRHGYRSGAFAFGDTALVSLHAARITASCSSRFATWARGQVQHMLANPEGTDQHPPHHRLIRPPVLYFGTPVALVTTISPDGSENIGPMSSAWALGYTIVMGWETKSQTLENLEATGECVINLPGPELAEQVEALAPLTGRNPPAEHNKGRFIYEPNKFAAAGLTRLDSECVAAPRIAECSFQLEAKVTAVHQPATPDAEHFRIVETHVERIHADETLIKDERDHIDTSRWSPLLYVFRHYFATGSELGRTFRAED
jgi:flavin reductase (DIM6/NTAB) family NADH-FMN oxidoreductase RutF